MRVHQCESAPTSQRETPVGDGGTNSEQCAKRLAPAPATTFSCMTSAYCVHSRADVITNATRFLGDRAVNSFVDYRE